MSGGAAADAAQVLIEARGLSRAFAGTPAVSDLSFRVRRGEVLGFLGPNGAGKTTTMRMLAGTLTPDAGSAWIAGHDVHADAGPAKSALGYLPEGAPVPAEMRVEGFLNFIVGLRGLRGSLAEEAVEEAMRRLQLDEVRRQRAETLSKGFQRRLGLAAALLHRPQALILDEPTDGLDPNQKHEVRDLIRALSHDRAILISTHLLEEVEAVCDRVIVIARGKLRADTTPAELQKQSRYHNAVSVRVKDSIAARAALDGMPGLTGFAEEHDGSLSVFSQRSTGLLDAVDERLRRREIVYSDLRMERGRLDEVFRTLTQDEEPRP